MSFSGASNFVVGDENLDLHRLFDFSNTFDAAKDLSFSAKDLLAASALASPFAEHLEDFQGQQLGWLSPPATGPISGFNAVNIDDFLAFDEDTDDLPIAAAEEALAPPPPELTAFSTHRKETAAAPEPTGDIPAVSSLKAAQAEIVELKAALAAEIPQHKVSATPGGSQSSSNPRKRRSTDDEMSPPKNQVTNQIGPIETLWFPKVTKDGRLALNDDLASPTKPKAPPTHLEFASPFTPSTSNPYDFEISPQDLHSIQTFLSDNPALVHGTSHHVDTSTPASNITMAHPVDTKFKRIPLKQTSRRARKTTTNTATRITKKTKAIPKKAQQKRTTLTTSITSPIPTPSARHRSIEELLSANFYNLNEQEKTRVLLPMLRNLDPRMLEASLAELPSIQAKGLGHEIRVARAIHNSPTTPEADDLLATKLTSGTLPSPTPAAKFSTTSLSAPVIQTPPLSHKVSRIEVSEELGTMRQREALDKAALLQAQAQAQCKKR